MKSNHILLTVLLLSVFCLALAGGVLYTQSAGAQECPADCKQLNLDVNKDGFITVTDTFVLMKCIKSNCTDPALDVNGDGVIDQTDYKLLTECINKGCSKAE